MHSPAGLSPICREITKQQLFISEIAAASPFIRFLFLSVVGLAVRDRSGHRADAFPGLPLPGVELFLFFLALFAERHKSVHQEPFHNMLFRVRPLLFFLIFYSIPASLKKPMHFLSNELAMIANSSNEQSLKYFPFAGQIVTTSKGFPLCALFSLGLLEMMKPKPIEEVVK